MNQHTIQPKTYLAWFFYILLGTFPLSCLASQATASLHATGTLAGLLALGLFILAYSLVMAEEAIHLKKSKPTVMAAGLIWIMVALISLQQGGSFPIEETVRAYVTEYAELFLFLLVAMTYVNTMEERLVFEKLRSYLVAKHFSFRQLFWITGFLAFFISPIADNLTTALFMCAVALAVGTDNPRFIGLSCINIVVAANAGGAFSPFGDITTLMVWQKGLVDFQEFFRIFLPSLINYLIPASIMFFALPKAKPQPDKTQVHMKIGAKRVTILFLLTVATTVLMHNYLHLPPVVGMMTGLGYLFMFTFYIKRYCMRAKHRALSDPRLESFDIFQKVRRAEWDTLLFFYGIILCVGGLATIGYLESVSSTLYEQLGASLPAIHQATPANIAVGLLSAVVDNIPIMLAVLTMLPDMSHGQWLLVTLTAGVGGSLLSIGSAAGVALMGQSRGYYTFFSHLKWTWAIMLGYIASVACHLWLNADLFHLAI